jgi:transcriptional regulator with XRE-family HTH domain
MSGLPGRLQEALGARGWRYKDLAARTGMTANYIGVVARGGCDPTSRRVADMARALGVSADWLLGLSDEKGGGYGRM